MGRVCMVRDLVAELVMGRFFYGPSWSWAEFAMGRDVPESWDKPRCLGIYRFVIHVPFCISSDTSG